jgi:hypothetical protein
MSRPHHGSRAALGRRSRDALAPSPWISHYHPSQSLCRSRHGSRAALAMDLAQPSVADPATPSVVDPATPLPLSPWISRCPPSRSPRLPVPSGESRGRAALTCALPGLVPPSVVEPAKPSAESSHLGSGARARGQSQMEAGGGRGRGGHAIVKRTSSSKLASARRRMASGIAILQFTDTVGTSIFRFFSIF